MFANFDQLLDFRSAILRGNYFTHKATEALAWSTQGKSKRIAAKIISGNYYVREWTKDSIESTMHFGMLMNHVCSHRNSLFFNIFVVLAQCIYRTYDYRSSNCNRGYCQYFPKPTNAKCRRRNAIMDSNGNSRCDTRRGNQIYIFHINQFEKKTLKLLNIFSRAWCTRRCKESLYKMKFVKELFSLLIQCNSLFQRNWKCKTSVMLICQRCCELWNVLKPGSSKIFLNYTFGILQYIKTSFFFAIETEVFRLKTVKW